jgi:GNAT superfamily N-acetyltransferase
MKNSPIIRKIQANELPSLLSLYRHLHLDDPALAITSDIESLWHRILANPQLHYFVADVAGQIVSTCTLTVILNLTRRAHPYGLVENVVTHPDFRKQGIGTKILQTALEMAWAQNCYKVMLLTGRKDQATLRFYERSGFKGGIKTGFVAKP